MAYSVDRPEIVFFDLETTFETRTIIEFGSIFVCQQKLIELDRYETLVRPDDLSLVTPQSIEAKGITVNDLVSAPTFSDIADRVYDILHGRVWAGHNILNFDCVILWEAYAQINKQPPVPKGTIDTLPLLRHTFGPRAGNMKMASLAAYFGLGQQSHRSLGDVRMNLEIVKCCASVLFLESSQQEFIEPDAVSMDLITITVAPFFQGSHGMQIFHRDIPLQIRCNAMRIRFGIDTHFVDHAGKPRLCFVVDANSNLYNILDAFDIAKRFVNSDRNLEWTPVVNRNYNSPAIRLHIQTEAGDTGRWITEIYHKKSTSPSIQPLVSSSYDVGELELLFRPGFLVDAYFSFAPYIYRQNAGIRLVAKKLIVHTN